MPFDVPVVPTRRRAALPALGAAALLFVLGGCGAVQPGGQYSGVPDTTVGDWRWPSGTISTGGEIRLERERGF